MVKTENFEKFEITSASSLREWLLKNHTQPASIWLVTFKKSELEKYVSREEVLDELLCFGWIDGLRRKLDNKRTMQLIGPRRTQHWAQSYKFRVSKLIEANKMHQAGLESIKSSKENGLWNFMDDVDNLIIPEDLKQSLLALGGAYEFFNSINNSSKRFVLRWIKLAKTNKTRLNRIDKIALLSKNGQKLPGS